MPTQNPGILRADALYGVERRQRRRRQHVMTRMQCGMEFTTACHACCGVVGRSSSSSPSSVGQINHDLWHRASAHTARVYDIRRYARTPRKRRSTAAARTPTRPTSSSSSSSTRCRNGVNCVCDVELFARSLQLASRSCETFHYNTHDHTAHTARPTAQPQSACARITVRSCVRACAAAVVARTSVI